MSSVDTRVVEMIFDNDSFQKGVEKTMAALEKLDSSLDLKNSGKELAGLKDAVGEINFDSVENGLMSLENTASTVFRALKDNFLNLNTIMGVGVLGSLGAITSQIISGGNTRAANIEQAKFQLKGLGIEWEQVSESLDYAVKDTAYGLDEAAKAASQYAASGVALGEDMSMSLRAISGVAAMTNSSFDDTARIFTTVAGNGRVMAMQLNQLGMRGLNAAAVLAEHFHVTEAELREMVSHGEVSFYDFAEAMDKAFGEHAKKANETFSGALANMKAALSRIGADFITPIREAERKVFLGLTAIFNNVRAGFNAMVHSIDGSEGTISIVSSFTKNIDALGAALGDAFTKVGKSNVIMFAIRNFTQLFDALLTVSRLNIEPIIRGIFGVLSGMNVGGFEYFLEHLSKAIYEFGSFTAKGLNEIVDWVVPSFKKIFGAFTMAVSGIRNIVLPVFDAIFAVVEKVFGLNVDNLFRNFGQGLFSFATVIENLAASFQYATRSFSHNEGFIKLVSTIAEGLLTVVKTVMDIAGILGRGVFTFIGDMLGNIGTVIVDVFGTIGNFTTEVSSEGMSSLADGLTSLAEGLSNFIGAIPTKLKDLGVFDAISGFLSTIIEFGGGILSSIDLTPIGEFIKAFATGAWDKIQSIDFMAIKRGLSSFFHDIDFEGIKGNVVEKLKIFLELLGKIKDFFGTKIDEAGSFWGGVIEAFKEIAQTDVLGKLSEELDKIKGSAKEVVEPIQSLVDTIRDFIDGITMDDITTVLSGIAAGFLAFEGMHIIKNIRSITDNIASFVEAPAKILEAVKAIPENINLSLVQFTDTMKALQTDLKADVILKIAAAVGILAASIFLLSIIDPDRLAGAATAVGILTAMMAGAALGLTKMLEGLALSEAASPKKLAGISAMLATLGIALVSLSVSVLILAAAVAIFGNMPIEVLVQGGITVVALIFSLAAAIKIMEKATFDIFFIAEGIAIISVSLIVLAGAIVLFALIPVEMIIKGVSVIAGLLIGLIALIKSMHGMDVQVASTAVSLIVITEALIAFALACMLFSLVDYESILKASLALLALSGSMILLSKFAASGKSYMRLAASMIILSVALLGLAGAMRLLSGADPDRLRSSAEALVFVIGALAVAIAVMQNVSTGALLSFAVVVTSLLALAGALAILQNFDPATLLAIAAVLTAFMFAMTGVGAVAGRVAAGLEAFAVFALAMGVSFALAGVGLMAFAAGLVTLATLGPSTFKLLGTTFRVMIKEFDKSIPALKEMFINLADAMAEASGPMSESFKTIFINSVKALIETLPELGTELLRSFGDMVVSAADAIDEVIPKVTYAGTKLVLGIAKGIRDNEDVLYGTIEVLLMTLGTLILNGIAEIADLAGFHGIAEDFRMHADQMAADADAKSAEILGILAERYPEMADVQDSYLGKMEERERLSADRRREIQQQATEEAKAIVDDYAQTMDADPHIVEIYDDIFSVDRSMVAGLGNSFKDAGVAAVNGMYNSGVSGIPGYIGTQLNYAAANARSSGMWDSGYYSGSQLGYGLESGIRSMWWRVNSAANSLANAAASAVNLALMVHSPSRVAIAQGQYYGEGLAIGIENMIGAVRNASTELANAAVVDIDPMGFGLQSIFDDIDLDSNPTITPVLDLSNVEAGAALMQGLLTPNNIEAAAYMDRRNSLFAAPGSSNSSYATYGNVYLSLDYTGQSADQFLTEVAQELAVKNRLGG